MDTDKGPKAKQKKKTKARLLKWVLAGAIALIVLAVLLVPAFVSSEKCRQIILAKVNDSVEGRTDFASLSMSWWRGVKVTDFSFNDDAGQTFVRIKEIATKPRYSSLLLGILSFGKTVIDEPRVEINLTEPQPQEPESSRQKARDGKAIGVPVRKIDLVITDGNLKVTDAKARRVELSQINSKVNLRPPGKQTNFDVDMTVADEGKEAKVHAGGQIKPDKKTGWSLKGTSGGLSVEVNDLELASLGPIFALGGIEVEAKGRVSANINSSIKDGRIEDLGGTIEGRELDITGEQLKGDRLKTSVLDASVKLHREEALINIDELRVHSDWLDANASGYFPTTFESTPAFATASSDYRLNGVFECDLGEALSQMPRTFGLKEGVTVTSGKLSGKVETVSRAGKVEIHGSGSLADLAGVVGEKRVALSEPVTAEMTILALESGMKLDKVDVSASFAKVNCTGDGELIRYTAEMDLAKLQSELGQFVDIGQYKIAGEVLSKGEVSRAEDRITAVGSSSVKELRVSRPEEVSAYEPKADIGFSITIEPKESVLDVNLIKVKASLGEVTIEDSVFPLSEEAAKPMKLAVSASNVDLAKLQPFGVLLASFPKEMQLAGIAESKLSVSRERDNYRIVTEGTRVRDLKVSYPGKEPFEQKEVSLAADVEVNPVEKSLNIKKLEVVSPQIKIHKAEIRQVSKEGKSKLEGEVDCEYNWSAVSTLAAPYLPEGLKLEGERKDTISFSSEYPAGQTDKLLANLNTKAKLGFEKAEYVGLNFGPTEVAVEIEDGVLKIAPFSTAVNGGKLNFAGTMDLKERPMVLRTTGPMQMIDKVNVDDEVSRRLLTYVNPIFARASKVSGVANLNCEKLSIPLAAENRNEIEVVGTILIERLRLEASDLLGQVLSFKGMGVPGQNLTIRPTRFTLQNDFLRYDNMQVDVGDNPINFTNAIIGLDKSYDMTVILPWTLSGKTVSVDEDVEGERIRVRLKTAAGERPKLDLGSLLEDQLKQRLKEELRKGLEELFK